MSAQEISLIVDADRGVLLESFDSTREARPLEITNGDKKPIQVRVARRDSQTQANSEIDLTGQTIRVGIGAVADDPKAGTFTLTHSGNETSALNYNASASDVETALEALASISAVDVTKFADGGYRIVWGAVGAQTAITADTTGLFPTTSAFIEEAVAGNASTKEVVVIALETDPAAYVELSTALDSAAATVTQVQDYAANVPEISNIVLDPAPYAGTWTITVAGETTEALPWDATTTQIKTELEALASITAGDVTVTGAFPDWTITFAASGGDPGAVSVDVTALTVPAGRKGEIELRTAEMLELLDGAASVSASLEVVVHTTATSRGWTACQVPVTVVRDLISDSPASTSDGTEWKDSTNAINWREDILVLTGGSASALDSIATVDLAVGYMVAFRGAISRDVLMYRLEAGTEAEDDPNVIRPDDYTAVTNEKIWTLMGFRMSGLEISDPATYPGVVIDADNIHFGNLPTSDPALAGRLWNDAGTVKVSAG